MTEYIKYEDMKKELWRLHELMKEHPFNIDNKESLANNYNIIARESVDVFYAMLIVKYRNCKIKSLKPLEYDYPSNLDYSRNFGFLAHQMCELLWHMNYYAKEKEYRYLEECKANWQVYLGQIHRFLVTDDLDTIMWHVGYSGSQGEREHNKVMFYTEEWIEEKNKYEIIASQSEHYANRLEKYASRYEHNLEDKWNKESYDRLMKEARYYREKAK